MAKREVTVVINGEEYVSKAADSADTAMSGFASKIPGWGKALAVLAVAYQAISTAVGAAKEFVMNSIEAYDRFSASQRKLEGTAKLSGIALGALRELADNGRRAFGLAAGTSNDFASEIGKLTSKAGDIEKSKDAMAAFLDIGAARGLSAADTLKAVQQAVLGIDEGTDKLFSKNPSVLYEEYADKIGKSAAKLSDQEKAQALLDAALTGGEATRGSYLSYLESAAGQQDQLNQKVEESQVRFGEAIQPIRTLILQGLNKLLDVLGPLVLWLGETANSAGVTIVLAFGKMREAVGNTVQAIGRITGNKDLEAWGKETADAARKSMQDVEDTVKRAAEATKRKTEDTSTAIKNTHKSLGEESKKSADTVEKESDRLNKALDAKLGKPMAVTIGITQTAISDLSTAAKNQLPPETAQKFAEHMKSLAERAEESRLKMIGMKDEAAKGRDTTRDVADNMGDVADAALSAADEFGVIDEKASKSLESAKKIFDTFGEMAKNGFSFAGAVGVIGGVASIVSTMMQGDAERKRLLAQNNDALDRLRKGIGGLKLNITGEDFQNAQTALGSVVGQLRGGRGAANENDVRNALYAQGLTMADFDRIAKEFGIEVRTKSGALNVDSVKAVFDALNTVQFGSVGKAFTDQLEFFRNSQRVNGADGAGGLQALIDFLRTTGNVRALEGIDVQADPQAALQQLRALFAQLGTGQGIGASQLGRLTGSQFSDLLMELIGGLTSGAPSSGGGTVTIDTGTGSGGTVTVPTDTVQSVIKAMDANLANILTSHTVIHERIAVATEGTYAEMQILNGKMDTLIAVTAGPNRADAMIEEQRYLLKVQQGGGAAF